MNYINVISLRLMIGGLQPTMDRSLINHIIGIVAVILVLGAGYLIKTKWIGDDRQMQGCYEEYESFYYELMAEKNKDASLCDKIMSGDKAHCKAVVNKDVNYCNKFDGQAKTDCKKEITKDPSACGKEEYFCLAEYTGNAEYCNKLKSAQEKEECSARTKLDAEYFLKNKKKLCKEVIKEMQLIKPNI